MKSRFLVLVLAAVLAVPAFSVMAADGSSADTSDGTESSGFEITYTLKGTEYTVSYDGPDYKAVIFGYAVGKTVDQAGMYSKIYAAGPYANNALAEDGNEKVQRLPSLYNSGNIDQIYATLVQAAENGDLDKENTTVILTTYIDNSLNLRNKLTEAGFTHILFYGSIESYDQVVSCVSDIEKALGSSEGLADSMTQTEEEVTAALSGAALLGSPLSCDFCAISLSDYLTPADVIEKRLKAAGEGDFCIVLYNPGSRKRKGYLAKACDILLAYRDPGTICGIVRNIGREGEEAMVLSLEQLRSTEPDMFTTVFIGNSTTLEIAGRMVTPRGYQL